MGTWVDNVDKAFNTLTALSSWKIVHLHWRREVIICFLFQHLYFSLQCIKSFVYVINPSAHFQSQSLENEHKIQKKIEECEASLPRNKSCEILVIAKVKEE